jgi:hypothetical protein
MLQTAEHFRCTDAHTLYRVLREVAGKDDCTLADCSGANIPDADGHPPAVERFQGHFGAQFSNPGPPPPAIKDDDWLRYIPQHGAGELWSRAVSWKEVYLTLFPPHMTVQPDLDCAGGGTGCALCKKYLQQLRDWNGDYVDLDGKMPCHTPHLNTSVSGGPDGIRPEFLSWARPRDMRHLVKYRKAVAREIACWCESVRRQGKMPKAATLNRTVPIAKSAKPGSTLDPSDPASYRPITMGDVLPKVLGLVIAKRLMHWAVATEALSPEQIGFMEGKGCEDHVFTLLETIKYQWRRGSAAYALFVDLAKAYDSVHPTALWVVLERMGVPRSLVGLLRDWSSKRQTVISVNGADSEAVPMLLGLGQGDVLSPLLFNLFTDSMTRYVKATAGYRGLDAFGVNVQELKYADDSVFFGDSPEQLQLVADAIQSWCEAWGLTVSTGAGKTEAMEFPTPLRANRRGGGTETPGAGLPALRLGGTGHLIKWTQAYRYLGLHLTSDLDLAHMAKKALLAMQGAWNRYFVATSFVRKSTPALALEVFRTVVTAGGNYLLGILPLHSGQVNDLDRFVRGAARTILGMRHHTNAQVLAESRLLPARALILRDRTRLWLKYQHSSLASTLAARVFRAAWQELGVDNGTLVGRPRDYRLASWCHLTALYFQELVEQDLPHPRSVMSIAPTAPAASIAARLARRIAVHEWRRLGQPSQAGVLEAAEEWEAEHGRPHPSMTGGIAALNAYYEPPFKHIDGYPKQATPMSCRGPACSGGILSLVNKPIRRDHWEALLSAQLGRLGVIRPPFALGAPTAEQLAGGRGQAACPHATCRAAYCDFFHVAFECSHPSLSEGRQHTTRAAARIASRLLTDKNGPDLHADVTDFSETTGAWESRAGCFMLHRLLTATTWSHKDIARGYNAECRLGLPTAALWLGLPYTIAQHMDSSVTKMHLLRPLANQWVTLAADACASIARQWRVTLATST